MFASLSHAVSMVVIVALLGLGGCATTESTKDVTRKGDGVALKEAKKCSGWGCATANRPGIISPEVEYGGYGRGHYPGAYYQYQPPSVGYSDPRGDLPRHIEYVGEDPNARGTGIWHARVDGRWKNCDGRNRDRWDSCFTPRGEANANKWGDSSAPR